MYDIPIPDSVEEVSITVGPARHGGVILHRTEIHSISITNLGAPRSGLSMLTRGTKIDSADPPPVSILVASTHLYSTLERFVLSTERVDAPSPRAFSSAPYHYRYVFSNASPSKTSTAPANCYCRLLAGPHRTLAYTVLHDDTSDAPLILGLCRYHDDHISDGVSLHQAQIALHQIGIGFHEDSRISAMAWDDTIARACFANHGKGCVMVIDFAHVPTEGTHAFSRVCAARKLIPSTDIFGRQSYLPYFELDPIS